jgi:hypothetical protein
VISAASLFLISTTALPVSADTIALTAGLVINRSVVVQPGEYRLVPARGDSAVVRIRGAGIEVDFGGAALVGAGPGEEPDQYRGIAVLIEGGRNVTLKNATIRGYKIGVLARGTRNLTLDANDVSLNWKPRLWSGMGHESLVDWLSYHHNEKDEWLRYGAGIYLANVRGGAVRGNTARQGMNGLLLVGSSQLRIWNNDFSFLSGLGIGLYRSSENRIMHNRVDWCIRGYVHGVYSRGQDSAALLLYEQSSRNVVAYNSMTHSGDGVFLWAGQSTMDSGKGGANDNLFFGNDLSFAAANAVEVTFSRNRIIGNRLEGSNYGVWGGYSFQSEIRANYFWHNDVGIAVEHGQENGISGNTFDGDRTAIQLWWNPIQPSDWGYPKHRDTRSRDYRIEENRFHHNRVGLRLENTTLVRLRRNQFAATDTLILAKGDTSGFAVDQLVRSDIGRAIRPWRPDSVDVAAPRPLPGGIDPFLADSTRPGRESILVDEWGPYDWLSPRLWPAHVADSAYRGGSLALVVLGPAGSWRLVASRGVASLSDSSGAVGDTTVVTPTAGAITDWSIELEYRGREIVAPNGDRTTAGSPYHFSYRRFAAPIGWTVRVVAWDSSSDPRLQGEAFRRRLTGPPLVTRSDSSLDYMWSRPRLPGFPAQQFALGAEGEINLPAGEYRLVTISDDGIRVWVDDQLVIDQWTPHESLLATGPIGGGRHRLRVEYYQVDGWVELRVEIHKQH